jgi:hypothetical protein
VLTLPPNVSIDVAAQLMDALKSFDGLCTLVESSFGLDPLSGPSASSSTDGGISCRCAPQACHRHNAIKAAISKA